MTAYVRRQTYIVIIIINYYFPFTEGVARLKGQGGGKIRNTKVKEDIHCKMVNLTFIPPSKSIES